MYPFISETYNNKYEIQYQLSVSAAEIFSS